MWNGVVGDIVGSFYEHKNIKGINLSLINESSNFTDDTVLLTATADALLNDKPFKETYIWWGKKYPDVGYGDSFKKWLNSNHDKDGQSYGNGAAARASIIGFVSDDVNEVLDLAKESATCSHSHEEGINGAQATALSVLLVRQNKTFEEISKILYEKFSYLLFYDLDELHANYTFDSSAENTVPLAIYIGLKSNSLEECINNCIYIGGDVDTISLIANIVFSAKNPSVTNNGLNNKCYSLLSSHTEIIDIITKFSKKYNIAYFNK